MTKAERFERLANARSVRSDLRGNSVRAAAYMGTGGAADFLLRILSTAILARLLAPDQFGLVMMVTAVTTIADQFRELGLTAATIQAEHITHEEVSNLFWINLAAGIIIALVICAGCPLIAAYYREPRLIPVTCVLSANFVWSGLMVQHQALLTRQLQLGHTAIVRLISSVASTGLALFLAWKGAGYWALVWREFARGALVCAGMWVCLPWIPSLPDRRTSVRELVRFGGDMTASSLLSSVSGSTDRFLIGRFYGAGPVAMYRQAYQLLVVPMEQVLGPLFAVTHPGLSLLQSESIKFRRFYQKILTVACVATMPLSVFVAIYAHEITHVLLGHRWADSAVVLSILSLGTFIKSPISSSSHVLITRGHTRTYLKLTLWQNVTIIALMCIGVRWGVRGVAGADVAAAYLMAGPMLYFCFRDSPVSVGLFLSTISRPTGAAAVTAAVLWFLHSALPTFSIGLIALACVVTAVTFFGVWLILPHGRAELFSLAADVRSALRRKIARTDPEPAPA